MKVKICGIRRVEAAVVAAENGADFLGFNFVPSSRRYIEYSVCEEIIDHVRSQVQTVGVFQNEDSNKVNMIADLLGLDFVQLHGEEDKEYMKKIKRPIIKSVTIANFKSNTEPNFFLLDRLHQGKGEMVDLKEATQFAKQYRIFFAGGLTPDNVGIVVNQVKPFAVDVAGGIETAGKEDMEKIKKFIINAKGGTL